MSRSYSILPASDTCSRLTSPGKLFCLLALGAFGYSPFSVNAQTPTRVVLEVYPVENNSIALAASVELTNDTPVSSPGLVTFQDGTRVIGSAQMIQNQPKNDGDAILLVSLGVGTHSLTATFTGTTSPPLLPSTSIPTVYLVTGPPAATNTLITSYSTVYPYSLTATINNFGLLSATGSVAFEDTTSSQQLGSVLLQPGVAPVFLQNSKAPLGSGVLAVADFNQDGVPDVASLSGPNTIEVTLYNRDGSFQPPQTYVTGSTFQSNPNTIAVGDLNSDGALDLAVTNDNDFVPGPDGGSDQVNTVGILLNNPNAPGTFQTEVSYPVGLHPRAVLVPDLNGDGIPDLAVVNLGGSVSVLLGNPAAPGSFEGEGLSYLNFLVPSALTAMAGDFNNDGRQDVAILTMAATLTVLPGNGDGSFSTGLNTGVPAQSYNVQGMAVGDVNGDGILDVVVSALVGEAAPLLPQSVFVYLGKGDGTFQAPVSYVTGADDTASTSSDQNVTIGDFNGDGIPDLAVACEYCGSVSVLLGDAINRGQFQPPTTTSFIADGVGAVASTDINGDGATDLLVTGDGTFLLFSQQSAVATLNGLPIGAGTQLVQAGYAGDSNHLASTSPAIKLTIAQLPTALSLMATLGAGQSFNLTASLTPYSIGSFTTSGETVTFFNGTAVLGTGLLNSQGLAMLTASLPGGQYSITASYGGDTNFMGSSSNAVLVNTPNTVNLQIAATQYVYPREPEFWIQFATNVGKPSPTGTVILYDGTTQIGSYTLAASNRGLLIGSLPNLSVGSHPVQANYGGDANYPAGQSDIVAVNVTPGPVNLRLNCASTTLEAGQGLRCRVSASEYPNPVTGTVNYTITGLNSGSATLNTKGQAGIAGHPPSSGTITVTYPAQGDHEAGGPVSVNFTVQ